MPRGKPAGLPKSGGRQKGSLNKLKLEVKEAIAAAFDEVGGKDYLIKLAASDPRTFCALVGKIVPMAVGGDPENPVEHIVNIMTGVPRPNAN